MPTKYEEMFKVLPEIAPCSVAAGSLAKKAFDLMDKDHKTEKNMVSVNNIGQIELGDIQLSTLSNRYGPRLALERDSKKAEIGYVSMVRGQAVARIAILTTLGDGPCNFIAFGDPDTELGSMEVTETPDTDREIRLQLIAGISDEINQNQEVIDRHARRKHAEPGYEAIRAMKALKTGAEPLPMVSADKKNPALDSYIATRYREVFKHEYDEDTYNLLDNVGANIGWKLEKSIKTHEDLGNGVSYEGTLTYQVDIEPSDEEEGSHRNFIKLSVRPDSLPDAQFSQIASFIADQSDTIMDVSNLDKPKDITREEAKFLLNIVSSDNRIKHLPVTFKMLADEQVPRTKFLDKPVKKDGEHRALPPKLQELYDVASQLGGSVSSFSPNHARRMCRETQKSICSAIDSLPSLSAEAQGLEIQRICDMADYIIVGPYNRLRRYVDLCNQIINITSSFGATRETENYEHKRQRNFF